MKYLKLSNSNRFNVLFKLKVLNYARQRYFTPQFGMGPSLILSSSLTSFSFGFIRVNILIRKMVVTTKSKSLTGRCVASAIAGKYIYIEESRCTDRTLINVQWVHDKTVNELVLCPMVHTLILAVIHQ